MAEELAGTLVETETCPVKTEIEKVDLGLESPVTVVTSKFSNKTQLIITETGKTSVIYQVDKLGEHPTFETTCLLGVETEETLVAARILGGQIQDKNPLIVAFGFKDPPKVLVPKNISALANLLKTSSSE